ncbi:diacylglycerol kinase (ATP) [Flavobacteriaceae bacterium MAR_2010_188]|nr:diacylglycerol kinase (ATP) [Flavobacteriaceae bacterium MAR_2010_188]
MTKKKDNLFINRVKSVGFAFKGAVYLIKNESSIQIQFVIAIIMTIAGFYFKLSSTEWLIQIAFIGMVMSIEGLNTAVEYIADFVHPDFHTAIGVIKDIAAGAVFIASTAAIIAGLIIYIPKFL